MSRWRNTRQPDWDWWSELWPEPRETLRSMGVEPGDRLVDAGCGNGYFTLPASELADVVYAVDLDVDLLAELRERAGEGVEAIEGDVTRLDELLPEGMDVVLMANTLHGAPEKEEFARAAHRSLLEGGRLIVLNWRDLPKDETTVLGEPRGPPPELRMSVEETREAVEPMGFSASEVVDVEPYHYAVVFRKD